MLQQMQTWIGKRINLQTVNPDNLATAILLQAGPTGIMVKFHENSSVYVFPWHTIRLVSLVEG